MGYGSGPVANGYGFGFQGPPWAGVIPDNPASRKRRGGISTILYFNLLWEIFLSRCSSNIINHDFYLNMFHYGLLEILYSILGFY